MTAVGNRPAGVSTLEQDLMRQSMAYFDAAPRTTFPEDIGVNSPWCAWDLKTGADGELYYVCRFAVPVDKLVDGNPVKKPFMRAKEPIGALTTYPPGYDTV